MPKTCFLRSERTLGDVLLAVTPANSHTVDDVALLGLVAQSASLVRAGGTGNTVDDVQLTVLPATRFASMAVSIHCAFRGSKATQNAPHAEKESEDI